MEQFVMGINVGGDTIKRGEKVTEKKEEEITGKTYLSEMTGKLNFSDPIEQKTEEVKA